MYRWQFTARTQKICNIEKIGVVNTVALGAWWLAGTNVSKYASAISPLLLHYSVGFTTCVSCPSLSTELLEPLNATIVH